GHASAFTAGACVAAGLATDPAVALGALIVALLLVRILAAPSVAVMRAPHAAGRLRTAVWTAVVVGLALAWRPPRLDLPHFAPAACDVVTRDDLDARPHSSARSRVRAGRARGAMGPRPRRARGLRSDAARLAATGGILRGSYLAVRAFSGRRRARSHAHVPRGRGRGVDEF